MHILLYTVLFVCVRNNPFSYHIPAGTRLIQYSSIIGSLILSHNNNLNKYIKGRVSRDDYMPTASFFLLSLSFIIYFKGRVNAEK